jgi:hypothetical protein
MSVGGEMSPVDIEAIKARLKPELNEPFFDVATSSAPHGCNHLNAGMRLEVPTRTVVCKCGTVVDAFDALLFYARVEHG